MLVNKCGGFFLIHGLNYRLATFSILKIHLRQSESISRSLENLESTSGYSGLDPHFWKSFRILACLLTDT